VKKIRALLVTPYHEAVGDGPEMAVRYAEQFPTIAPTIRDVHDDKRGLYTKLFALREWAINKNALPGQLPTVPEVYARYYAVTEAAESPQAVVSAFDYTRFNDPPKKWLTGKLGATKGHLRSVG